MRQYLDCRRTRPQGTKRPAGPGPENLPAIRGRDGRGLPRLDRFCGTHPARLMHAFRIQPGPVQNETSAGLSGPVVKFEA